MVQSRTRAIMATGIKRIGIELFSNNNFESDCMSNSEGGHLILTYKVRLLLGKRLHLVCIVMQKKKCFNLLIKNPQRAQRIDMAISYLSKCMQDTWKPTISKYFRCIRDILQKTLVKLSYQENAPRKLFYCLLESSLIWFET